MTEVTTNYKQTDLNTLRLPVDFLKLRWDDDVIFAYNVLLNKEKRKATFTTKAIIYYESHSQNDTIRQTLGQIANMKRLAAKYSLTTIDDLDELLKNTDLDKIQITLPVLKTPKKVLFGFNKTEDTSIKIFNKLFQMSCTERALYIAKAITTYVKDGYDCEWQDISLNQFLYDMAYEYQNGDDPYLMEDIKALFKSCLEIKPHANQLSRLIISDKMTDELAALFS